jgi:hypothetical protein
MTLAMSIISALLASNLLLRTMIGKTKFLGFPVDIILKSKMREASGLKRQTAQSGNGRHPPHGRTLAHEHARCHFINFSDSPLHLGFEGTLKLVNTYPESALPLCYWGSAYAPDMREFSADPTNLYGKIVNPA